MNANDKKKNNKIIIILLILILIIIVCYLKISSNELTYAAEEKNIINSAKISDAVSKNLEEIIQTNIRGNVIENDVYERKEELEYITKYRYNDSLYKGTTLVSQEGKNGIQTITMKRTYDNYGNMISEEQVSCIVTKSSIDKIIDIGAKIYVEPEKKSEIQGRKNLSFGIALNKPSGFSLEEFRKILTDKKDVNNIFGDNAEYFYYIEDEYNINGIFVASIGIHESAWGTSKIAKNKHNLFGYGAYDSNPYNGAYTFSNYSESIDLIARVLVKYYLNKPGEKIYDGQVASRKIL